MHWRLPLFGLSLLVALVLASPESSRELVDRGIKAAARKDFVAAEESFQLAIRQDPGHQRAYKLLGLLYATQSRYVAAEEPFRKACNLAPKDEEAWYYLGHLYFNLNRFEDSQRVFEQASRIGNESSRLLSGLGLTLEVLGRISEAEDRFKIASRRGDKAALRLYGQFLFRQGRLEESRRKLREAGDTAGIERVERAIRAQPRIRVRPPAEPVQFRSTALDMRVQNGGTAQKHLIETMLAGVAVFDYDRDGWPDLFVANGAAVPSLEKTSAAFHNRLYRNNRDGTFTEVTAIAGVAGSGYSMGVAAADYDNDGFTDLFVAGVRRNLLYHNKGSGRFEEISQEAGVAGDGKWSVAAGWFDYDRDGLLDLFVVRYVEWNPDSEPFCGDPKSNARSYCDPRLYRPLANVLYRNEGNSTFRNVSVTSGIAVSLGKGMGVAFGDYDKDGWIDVFVANDTVPNFLFRNLADGRFEEVALAAGVGYNGDGKAVSSMGVDFRDYDNDGYEDLFITALSNETFTLFRNIGNAGFQEASQVARLSAATLLLSGWSTGFYDFNNDGHKDIFTANGHVNDNIQSSSSLRSSQLNIIFVSRGNGTFDPVPVSGFGLHRGAAFGDFNRDGLIDVVVTALNEPPKVLWNNTKTSNQWLDVKLIGRRSNRDGIGASLRLTSADGFQWNRVTTSVGYAGSSEVIVHFGLGAQTVVTRVEVDWPSGRHQVLHDVRSNQRLIAEEPY